MWGPASELAGALERWKRRDPYALVADCFSLCPPPPLLLSTSAASASERTGDQRDHDHGDSGWDERVRLLCEQLQAVPRHRIGQQPQQLEAITPSPHTGEEAAPHVRDSCTLPLLVLDCRVPRPV